MPQEARWARATSGTLVGLKELDEKALAKVLARHSWSASRLGSHPNKGCPGQQMMTHTQGTHRGTQPMQGPALRWALPWEQTMISNNEHLILACLAPLSLCMT